MLLSNPAAAVASMLGFQDSARVNYTIQVILSPGLTIQQSASPLSYTVAGQNITYTYTVTNSGNVNISGNITVTDNILGKIFIPNNYLGPGQSVTTTANYTIRQSDIDSGSVINSAYATDQNNDINSKTVNTTVTFVQSAIGLSIPAPRSTFQGNLMTYRLCYQNFGQINVSNVVLTDTLPANVAFVSASDGGVYNNSTGTIT